MAPQGGIQRSHGHPYGLGISAGVGKLEAARCIEHQTVAFAQGCFAALPLLRLAVEGVVNRLAKSIPELLLQPALHGHALGLGLPALLQVPHGIQAQLGCGAEQGGLVNHRLAQQQALLLYRLQRRAGLVHGCLPQRLQFCQNLVADMPGGTPLVDKLVEQPGKAAPVLVERGGVGIGPLHDVFDHGQPLQAVFDRFGSDPLQPGFNHLVCLVAGFIEALPQALVGRAALIGLFPLLAQGAQQLLHFAATQGLSLRAFEQTFGPAHQFLAQLVGTPALPALELAGSSQRAMRLVLELVINQPALLLEGLAQRCSSTGTGFAVPLGNFLLQLCQRLLHPVHGLGADFGVDLGFLRFTQRLCRSTAKGAQFIGPDRHCGQGSGSVRSGGNGLRQCLPKRLPNHQELPARGLQERRETGLDTGPVAIRQKCAGLHLPMVDINLQGLRGGLRIAPRLGRENLDALCQQHCGLALHLHPVLQVFNALDPLAELALKGQQGLAAQGRAGFGGIALPGHGVSDVEFGAGQPGLSPVGPLLGNRFLCATAFDLVELFTQQLGRPFVFGAEFLEDRLHVLRPRVAGQPVANAPGALARGGGREGATSQPVEVVRLGLGPAACGHSVGLRSLGFSGKRKHGMHGKDDDPQRLCTGV